MDQLPSRPELRKFGYAPGGYMGRCRECDTTVTDIDKRATCCLSCAEALFKEETTDKSYFPLKIEYLDGGTAIVYSPNAIPSGKAFKVLETQYKG
jgi:hypothetical protein